jgi:hypothetical protein
MKISALLVGTILLGTTTVANAAPAADLTSPGTAYTSAPYTLGFIFTLGANTNATKLGIYDWNLDGLETDAKVGLWTDTGTLLASVSVGAGTAGELIGSYRYASIAPVALAAGSSYVVGSYMNSTIVGTASSFGTGQGGSGSFNPLITFAQDRYSNFDFTFGFPTLSDGNIGGLWAGGNVVFGVPEPANWAMLITGFGLIGAIQRRRRVAITA